MSTDRLPLKPDEIAIAHLSDLHLGSDRADEVWKSVEHFLTRDISPKLLLVTGDLVHTPVASHYEDAKKWLDNLRIPYYVCSGNHDRHVLGNRVDRKMLDRLLANPWVERGLRSAKTAGWWVVGTLVLLLLLIAIQAWICWGWLVGLIGLLFVGIGALIACSWFRQLPSYLLARLHSHFDRGDTNALFDRTFQQHLLTTNTATPFTLETGANGWEIGLLGLDSSLQGDCFARGHVPTSHVLPLRQATRGWQTDGKMKEFDLVILLIHHHLLSIRLLETEREGEANDLLNATCLVNAGTLLERLSEARVDLVLHGHEHKHNWGTYTSLEQGHGPVRIVAAGSATGNDSLTGCHEKDATLNLIVFTPDRSVWLRRVALEAGSWQLKEARLLFSAEHVRHSRTRRRALAVRNDPWTEITSEIIKYFIFTRERNIEVYWVMTNWWLEKAEFVHPVQNSTGYLPDDTTAKGEEKPSVILLGADNSPTKVDARFVRDTAGDTWNLCFSVPPKYIKQPVNITINFTWFGAALLTREELLKVKQIRNSLGRHRNENLEFATVWTQQPVAALELHVSLPPEYAPGIEHVKVRVEEGSDTSPTEFKPEASALEKQLHNLATGRYTLRIPYPRPNRDYTLVWNPVSERYAATALQSQPYRDRFAQVARTRGPLLLQKFAQVFKNTPLWKHAILALFLKSDASEIAECVAEAPLGPSEKLPIASLSVELTGERHCLRRAWWGEPVAEKRPNDPELAKIMGFREEEMALICVPIRFGLTSANPPPWGVVRIGVRGEGNMELPTQQDDPKISVHHLLHAAAAQLMAAALFPEKGYAHVSG